VRRPFTAGTRPAAGGVGRPVGADIELIPAEKINDAYQRVLASDVRYRFVVDNSTLH
jgi:D-arabinose 1-dehydrogenase-like Zn-dependent alcohol dehydrogenase